MDHLYQQALRSIINPLATIDSVSQQNYEKLASHLQQIFALDQQNHERLLQHVQNTKPSNVALHVQVIEARNLPALDTNGFSDPYCLLSIVKLKATSESGRPRSESHKEGQKSKSSPSSQKRLKHINSTTSFDCHDVKATQTIKRNLNPQWNERFELDVMDYHNEELHVFVWDDDSDDTVASGFKKLQKPSGLKSLLRQLRQSVEHGKSLDDFIGQLVVPLKDIPSLGCTQWFELYHKKKQVGMIHLGLKWLFKQTDFDEADSAESDQSSIQDFKILYEKMILWNARMNDEELPVIDGSLTRESHLILQQFTSHNQISSFTLAIIKFILLLENSCKEDVRVVPTSVRSSIEGIESALYQDELQSLTLTDSEISLLESAAFQFINHTMAGVVSLRSLFPPLDKSAEDLLHALLPITKLVQLNLWEDSAMKSEIQNLLKSEIFKKIKRAVDVWTEDRLAMLDEHVAYSQCQTDPVLPQTSSLADLLQEVCVICTPKPAYQEMFHKVNVNYYKTICLRVDHMLAHKVKELVHEMNYYQKRYQSYQVNIRDSSRISLKLFLAIKNIYSVLKKSIPDREVFKLRMVHFDQWFEESLIFWLETFKSECNMRMEKALEIDKDFVPVTSQVKHSNSSVDVLSSFAKITTEWRDIGVQDADHLLIGAIKISNVICDGTRLYADKIASILECNGYYDGNSTEFDINQQVCITVNNIEYIRRYLSQLAEMLNYEDISRSLTLKYDDDAVGRQSFQMLNRLISTASEDIVLKERNLLQKIVDQMEPNLNKHIKIFSSAASLATTCDQEAILPLIEYLDKNLKTFHLQLCSGSYPKVLSTVWQTLVYRLDMSILYGCKPEYYSCIANHIKTLQTYFAQLGLESDPPLNSINYEKVLEKLARHALPTSELLLQYFTSITENMSIPLGHCGQVALRVGYLTSSPSTISLAVQLLTVCDLPLPVKSTSQLNMVRLQLRLLPMSFCQSQMFQTAPADVDENTNTAEFDLTHHFTDVPKDVISTKGVVLHIMVWQFHKLGWDTFLGEVFINVCGTKEIHRSIDQLPVIMLATKMPIETEQKQSTVFEILFQRRQWDKEAKQHCDIRLKIMKYAKNYTQLTGPDKKRDFLASVAQLVLLALTSLHCLDGIDVPDIKTLVHVVSQNYPVFRWGYDERGQMYIKRQLGWRQFRIIHPGLSEDKQTISFESGNHPGYFLRHIGSVVDIELNVKPRNIATFYKDSTFIAHADKWFKGFYAFECVNPRGLFIRHSGYRLRISKDDGSDLFKKDSSFLFVAD